jgi:threonine/homoserine/homoserine lactone efflux protein
MIDIQTLLLFSVAVLTLLISPGPNMAFLLSHGISYGARGGLAVAIGIFAADLLLTALTALGITALIAAGPPSFDILRYLGALYLIWLGIQAIRQRGTSRLEKKQDASTWKIFRVAMLNSLLNPKALLFFMVFLPQFVKPDSGSIALQLLLLGIILSLIALVFHGVLGIASGKFTEMLSPAPSTGKYLRWLHAGVLFGLAARLLFLEKPMPR